MLVAHGLGGQQDLPIPLTLAVSGAVAALVVSFVVLGLAWREPRYGRVGVAEGRAVPGLGRIVLSVPVRVALKAFGVLAMAYLVVAAVAGQDLVTNPLVGIFLVWWWVGIVPFSLLLGPVWRSVSPHRTLVELLARFAGTNGTGGVATYPATLGYWPSALGLYAFVWFELVYPHDTELGPIRLWLAAYVAVMVVGGAVFGPGFLERADPFEVYSTLAARLSVWAVEDGRLLVRSPLANLDATVPRPGLVAVVAVLFGSTAYDSYHESLAWIGLVGSSGVSTSLLDNAALLGTCLVVGLLFAAACALTPVSGTPRRDLPPLFAHAVLPIVVGYVVAHYATYWLEQGQVTLAQASDPLSRGQNWFGTAGLGVHHLLSDHPTFLAVTKVGAVVAGHVVGVVASHERAVQLLGRRHRLLGQLPLLLVMVVFTAGGLFLLFSA